LDDCRTAVNAFDRAAETYAGKYFALEMYDPSYREFCSRIARRGGTVLDAACGPGNVTAFLARERPDLQLLGIDLAPNMVRLAQANVPSARFAVHDCRRLADLGRVFDAVSFAFGLNYLNQDDAERFFGSLRTVLAPDGVLYLSAMLGPKERTALHTTSSGDRVRVHYRPRPEIERLIHSVGLEIVFADELGSPAGASEATIDVVLVAQGARPWAALRHAGRERG